MPPLAGDAFVEFTENYQQTAYFGFMIKDTSRGSVRKGVHPDVPLLTYNMNKADFELYKKAVHKLTTIHLNAGAKKVTILSVSGLPSITNIKELDALFERKLKPKDFAVTAHHPLGTARIAKDKKHGDGNKSCSAHCTPKTRACIKLHNNQPADGSLANFASRLVISSLCPQCHFINSFIKL